MNDILNFLLNNLLFYYVWLPLIVSIAIIKTAKKFYETANVVLNFILYC